MNGTGFSYDPWGNRTRSQFPSETAPKVPRPTTSADCSGYSILRLWWGRGGSGTFMGMLSLRGIKKYPVSFDTGIFSYDPWGNRTPVYAVRGRRLSRLTNRPYFLQPLYYIITPKKMQYLFQKKLKKFCLFSKPPVRISRRPLGRTCRRSCGTTACSRRSC